MNTHTSPLSGWTDEPVLERLSEFGATSGFSTRHGERPTAGTASPRTVFQGSSDWITWVLLSIAMVVLRGACGLGSILRMFQR